MIAPRFKKTQALGLSSARAKLKNLSLDLEQTLRGESEIVPTVPGRDVVILAVCELPPKPGLSRVEGQARLLHDLASIELQAMELGLRTLSEYPDAPAEFRRELAAVTADEGRHFELCLDALDDLGFPWGQFPAHLGLWQAVSADDSLLDRILIVHRYLEGSGLDASANILRKLSGVKAESASRVVRVINRDEVGHVVFGGRWYNQICVDQGLNAERDFGTRLQRLSRRLPTRREPLNVSLRQAAGFSAAEIAALEKLRAGQNLNQKTPPALITAIAPRAGALT